MPRIVPHAFHEANGGDGAILELLIQRGRRSWWSLRRGVSRSRQTLLEGVNALPVQISVIISSQFRPACSSQI